jgi:hypothetical protein
VKCSTVFGTTSGLPASTGNILPASPAAKLDALLPVCTTSVLICWRFETPLSSSAHVQEFPSAALGLDPLRKNDLAELERLLMCFARIIVLKTVVFDFLRLLRFPQTTEKRNLQEEMRKKRRDRRRNCLLPLWPSNMEASKFVLLSKQIGYY